MEKATIRASHQVFECNGCWRHSLFSHRVEVNWIQISKHQCVISLECLSALCFIAKLHSGECNVKWKENSRKHIPPSLYSLRFTAPSHTLPNKTDRKAIKNNNLFHLANSNSISPTSLQSETSCDNSFNGDGALTRPAMAVPPMFRSFLSNFRSDFEATWFCLFGASLQPAWKFVAHRFACTASRKRQHNRNVM